MKLTIIRIEDHVITCELEDGGLIDIGRQWLFDDIKLGDTIDADIDTETAENAIKSMNDRMKAYIKFSKF